jgi:uncharacterized protein
VRSAKIVVTGGPGVGTTTFVTSVSEIAPLTTVATSVAMDFGRITVDDTLVVYVVGTPSHARSAPVLDDVVPGSLVALVIADTRRLADCYPAVDYFELRGVPFVMVINEFDGARRHTPADLGEALGLAPGIPIVAMDARDRDSARNALILALEFLLGRISPAADSPPRPPATSPTP